MEDSPTYGTQKPITNCLADSILKKHEDENEYHLHRLDRRWVIEAMEEYASQSHKKELLQAYIQGKRDEPVWSVKWEDLPFIGKYRRIKRFLKWFETITNHQ